MADNDLKKSQEWNAKLRERMKRLREAGEKPPPKTKKAKVPSTE